MGHNKDSVPTCVPVSMLLTAKLSGYLLSLLLASVFFFTGGESLSESQILLFLRAETHTQKTLLDTLLFNEFKVWGRKLRATIGETDFFNTCSQKTYL